MNTLNSFKTHVFYYDLYDQIYIDYQELLRLYNRHMHLYKRLNTRLISSWSVSGMCSQTSLTSLGNKLVIAGALVQHAIYCTG